MSDVSVRARASVAAMAPLLDAVADLVSWFDRDLRCCFVNAAMVDLLGRPASDFLGRSIADVPLRPDGAALWRSELEAVFRTNAPTRFEFDFEQPGGLRRFQASLSPVSDERGQVDSVLAISRDITDTRAMRLLEAAIAQLPTGVSLVDAPSGRLLLRNTQATAIFRNSSGRPSIGIAGYADFTGFKLDGSPYQAQDWPVARSVLSGEIVSGEVAEIQRGDGTRGFIRMSSAPLRDQNGTIIAGLVTFEDVTAERRARRSAETLQRIGAALGEQLDLKATLQTLTDETTALTAAEFGAFFYNAVDDAGESLLLYALSGARLDAFASFPAPRATALLSPTFRGESTIRSDDIREDPRYGRNPPYHGMPAGHLPVRSYLAVPVTSRSGEVLGGLFFGHSEPARFTEEHQELLEAVAPQAGTAIDNARLFERVKAADAARALLLEKERAARASAEAALRVRDEFVSAASHELRNPLNALQLQLTGLRRAAHRDSGVLQGEAALARLAKSEAQVERLVRLIDNLLDLSIIRAGKLQLSCETFDLVAASTEVVQQMGILGGAVITVHASERPIDGRWDRSRIEQVLTNLLSNAVKYGNRQPVDLTIRPDGDTVLVSVADRGIGIAGGQQDRLFEPFERLAPQRTGGFGLGLWITREIVHAMGGTIALASVEGRGSTFTVTLPRWVNE